MLICSTNAIINILALRLYISIKCVRVTSTRRRWATCQRYACTCSAREINCPPRRCQEHEQWRGLTTAVGGIPLPPVIRALMAMAFLFLLY